MTNVQDSLNLNKLCRMCMKIDNVNVDLFVNIKEKFEGQEFETYREFLNNFAQTKVI